MAVDGGRLHTASALLELGAERIEIAQHRIAGLAALEFGEALLEIVQQPGRVGTRGRCDLGRGTACGREAQRDHRNRAPPPLSSTAPGSQAQGLTLM